MQAEAPHCDFGKEGGAEHHLSLAIKKIPIQLVCNEAGLDKVDVDQIMEVASRSDYITEKYPDLFDNASKVMKAALYLENTIKKENMQKKISSKCTRFACEHCNSGEKTSNIRPYNWGNLDKFGIWSSAPMIDVHLAVTSAEPDEQRTEPEKLEDPSLTGTSTSKHENRSKDRYLQEIYDAIYGSNKDDSFAEGTPEYYKAAEQYALAGLNSSTQANQHFERENKEPACNRAAQAQQQASSNAHFGNGCPFSILPNVRNFHGIGNNSATTNYNSLYCGRGQSPHYGVQPNAVPIGMRYSVQPIQFNYFYPIPVSEFQLYYGSFYPYTPFVNCTINETLVNTSYMHRYSNNGNGGAILYAKRIVHQSRTYHNHTRSG